MLDQHWLGFFSDPNDINELPDDDLNAAVAVVTSMRLNRFAPAPVEQAAVTRAFAGAVRPARGPKAA